MGGHKLKAISGAHRTWLLQRVKDGDFTLRGLVAELSARGLRVDYRSVWAFVHAEKLSFKKIWTPNAIYSHAPATIGRGYGTADLADKAEALRRFPRFKV